MTAEVPLRANGFFYGTPQTHIVVILLRPYFYATSKSNVRSGHSLEVEGDIPQFYPECLDVMSWDTTSAVRVPRTGTRQTRQTSASSELCEGSP